MSAPIRLVCALAAFCACAAAHNFQDPYYNQLLDDYFNAYNEALQWREERELEEGRNETCKHDHHKHHHHKRHPCCGNFSIDLSGKKMDILTECTDKVKNKTKALIGEEDIKDPFNCTQLTLKKEKIVCIAECVGTSFGLVDWNGDITETSIRLREFIPGIEDGVKAHFSEAINTCLAKIKESEKEITPNLKCDMTSDRFMYCVWKFYESRCPEELQVHTKKCDTFRENLAKKKQH